MTLLWKLQTSSGATIVVNPKLVVKIQAAAHPDECIVTTVCDVYHVKGEFHELALEWQAKFNGRI